MKLMLIEPNIEGYALMPTMSLAILKGFINEKTEHKVKIVDLIFNKKDWKEYLFEKIKKEKPDLIGFSVLSFNYLQALKIAKFIKKNFKIKTIFGGVHCILSPEEVIENEEVDIVCVGEGEDVLKNLMDKKLSCEKVKGIWYKEKGNLLKNNSLKLIENLDELPFPDWSDFDLEKYFLINNNHLPIMGSRGCPYNCTYCSNHALKKRLDGKYVRFRSVDNILEEIELRMKQYYGKGFKYLFFYDDTFIIDKNFVLEFCKKFKEKGFDKKIKWNVNVRANLVTDEIIKAMKDAGCYEVRMGVESGNDYIRNKIYKRGMSKEQIDNAIEIIKKNDLQLRLQFIIGAPYEDIKMMEESFKMAKNSGADYILFPILMPLPDTEIKSMCEKEGIIEKQNTGQKFNQNFLPVSPNPLRTKFKGFNDFKNAHEMFTSPVVRTKFASKKQVKKMANKIRFYQMKKYLLDGFSKAGMRFIVDLLIFFIYYKNKYKLEIDHAFRFTINKYNLEKIEK